MGQIRVDSWTLRELLDIAADFYADPENQKAFERWKAQRRKEKRKKARRCTSTDEPKG